MISRLFLPVLASVLLFTAVVRADMPAFYSNKGAAIGGYDTVAYFTLGKPVRGKPDIAVMWKGALWLFSTRENREIFEANPRAYAPQYGGYCAYGMSKGRAAGTDPEAWKIVDGKLYLIHNRSYMKVWSGESSQYIASGNENWPAALRR